MRRSSVQARLVTFSLVNALHLTGQLGGSSLAWRGGSTAGSSIYRASWWAEPRTLQQVNRLPAHCLLHLPQVQPLQVEERVDQVKPPLCRAARSLHGRLQRTDTVVEVMLHI